MGLRDRKNNWMPNNTSDGQQKSKEWNRTIKNKNKIAYTLFRRIGSPRCNKSSGLFIIFDFETWLSCIIVGIFFPSKVEGIFVQYEYYSDL